MPPAYDAASVTRRWRRNASAVRRNFTVEMTFLGELCILLYLPLKLKLRLAAVLETFHDFFFLQPPTTETSQPSIFHVFLLARCRSIFSLDNTHSGCLAPAVVMWIQQQSWRACVCVCLYGNSRKSEEKIEMITTTMSTMESSFSL